MTRILLFALALFGIVATPNPSLAGNRDRVVIVYACGGDVGIQMRDAGWVVAQQVTLGEKRVDRILTIATALLLSGKPTSYFDDLTAATPWCGVTAKPITVLGIAAE